MPSTNNLRESSVPRAKAKDAVLDHSLDAHAGHRIPERVKRLFTETFTAGDIAQPLASFDVDAPAEHVRAFMATRDFDVVGVRNDGEVVGFIEKSAFSGDDCASCLRPLAEATVRNSAASLLTVIQDLKQRPFVFINVLGTVGGIVTLADMQKPPARMWLFGVLTLIEMRFAELIEQLCPGATWKQFLSEARLQKAEALLAERKRRNQELELLDCLQFSDKGQIVARNESIRNSTVFPSRRQAEETIKQLEQLRNNLAHSQDILATDWDTIIRLCEFVQHQ
jgi:hypothetical protein